MQAPEPTLRLRVNAQALADNWRALNAMSGAAKAGAAVKANAYGLGVNACVPALRDAGCESFFVAHWSEVAPLLNHVSPAQIAVLHGPLNDADVSYAIAMGVRPVINSLSQAQRWRAGGGGACHLMIDTGIHRLGISPSDLSEPAIKALDIDILMSHLSSADEDCVTNTRQLAAFRNCLPLLTHRSASLANSAGIALGPDYAFDSTRPGLSLYGGIARRELDGKIAQVAQIEAAIIQTAKLLEGDAVGYNGEFVAPHEMQVGTVSIGYADGFLRSCGARAGTPRVLLHEGKCLPLLGKVSMDMVVVDLNEATELREGDWLAVQFDLPDAAQHSGLSQYELLTVLGQRFAS